MATSTPELGKRLIVACDGTWMNSDDGYDRPSWFSDTPGELAVPTNVTRICRALKQESEDGRAQVVYYQAGIGSQNNPWAKYIGGITGLGISENIREAYAFLACNYRPKDEAYPGDEIFLLGFSRGAFTARSIAGFIAEIGLLTRLGMVDFYPIFEDWENQSSPKLKRQWPDKPFQLGSKSAGPKIVDGSYAKELAALGKAVPNVNIKAVGVWETVGELGMPDIGWIAPFQYAFINTELSPNVEHAFHALALDEHRRPFAPTVWEKPAGQALPLVWKQCWFAGVHSNVGGGYVDTETSDMSLAWMMSQLDRWLTFDPAYFSMLHAFNVAYHRTSRPPQPLSGWAGGRLYDSYTGLYYVTGSQWRHPGQYTTSTSPRRLLRDTHEHVHASVRVRMHRGRANANGVAYAPRALLGNGWHLVEGRSVLPAGAVADASGGAMAEDVVWQLRDSTTFLPEEQLGKWELRLLNMYPNSVKSLHSTALEPDTP